MKVKASVGLYLLTLLFGTFLIAGPLKFEPQILKQPDGSILNCFASGDEFYNWLHDANGYTIIQNEKGFFVYAKRINKELLPSALIPGKSDPVSEKIDPWLKHSPEQIQSLFGYRFKRFSYENSSKGAPTTGTINNIVVFIRFSNESEFTDAVTLYDGIFNDPAGVSLNNYFKEVSYSSLVVSSSTYPSPPGSTVISYQDSNPRAYYMPYSTSNPTGYQADEETREEILLQSALNYIKTMVPSGLIVDSDGDGLVDNVCFIVYGSPTGWSSLLWPHKATLSSARSVYLNGARVSDYNMQLQSSVKSSGPSPLAHEMFHTLGAADLYHYTDNDMSPVGSWDLMASNTKPPQHTSAYMKFRYGKWISEIPEITQSGTYTLNPLISSTNNCYKLLSPGSPNEYFVLEYRKKTGLFESSLPGEGLVIYRINTAVTGGNRNGPPDAVYIFRPDGTLNNNGILSSAAFSANSGRTAFSNNSNPACFLTDGSKGNIKISNIGTSGSTISFTVTIDQVYASIKSPVAQAQWITGSQKTIEWVSGGGADTMIIDYSQDNGQIWKLISGSAVSPYSWEVPGSPSMSCRLRIRSDNMNGIADSINFAISPPFAPLLTMYDATEVTGGASNSGIVIAGNEFWTSRNNSSLLHRWSFSGSLLQEFSIAGVTDIRALTTDGTFIYATNTTAALYKIDPATRTLVSIITLPVASRFATFDQSADAGQGGFWIGNTTGDWILVNSQGSEISRIPMTVHKLASVYGLVCDNLSSYKPSLWAYTRSGGTAGTPQYIVQVKLPEGTQTGLFHDVLQEVGAGAGNPAASSLSLGINSSAGKPYMCGVNSGTPNYVFFYDFSNPGNEPISLNAMDEPYSENFDGFGVSSVFELYNNISLRGIYAYRTLDNAIPNVFTRSAGGTVTGGFFNYGTTSSSTDRAMGGIQSSITSTLYYGIRLKNNTGLTIRSVDITYAGEQWRTGGSSTVQITNVLSFGYLQAGSITDLTSGTYTSFDALSFTSPRILPYYSALDGNNGANRSVLSANIPVTIPPGEEIMLRWQDVEDPSYDHAFAIDDFSVTPRSVVTGNKELPIDKTGLLIYPNPAGEVLNIDLVNTGNGIIRIIDLTGRCIFTDRINNSNVRINISGFPEGLYLVRFDLPGKTFTEKFIKK